MFSNYKKSTTLIENMNNGGGCAHVGTGATWEISELLTLLWTYNCCKKINSLKKRKVNEIKTGQLEENYRKFLLINLKFLW